MKWNGVALVKVTTKNDDLVFSSCRAREGVPIPIDRALEELAVPNACTSPEGCRCSYVGVHSPGE
jgi:hypothetical protein